MAKTFEKKYAYINEADTLYTNILMPKVPLRAPISSTTALKNKKSKNHIPWRFSSSMLISGQNTKNIRSTRSQALNINLLKISPSWIDDPFPVRALLFVVNGIAIEWLFAGLWWRPAQSDESTGHNSGLHVQRGWWCTSKNVVVLAYIVWHTKVSK